VLDMQETINGSLADIQATRTKLGRGSDPVEKIDVRTAAYILAVKRVADVTLQRGIWP